MKKITKIVVFYDDGTFSESTPSFVREETKLPYPTIWPCPVPVTPDYKTCGKCGMKLEGVMGYCCPHSHCPTGLGGSWSSTTLE